MVSVSEDLPDYLKTKYSVLVPSTPVKPMVTYKSALRYGISAEAPPNFHVNFVDSLDTDKKDYIKLGVHYDQNQVYSRMKRNRAHIRSQFTYEDQIQSSFDYNSLTPSKVIDLIADKSPTLKQQTGFALAYTRRLSQGFGLSRGECAVEAVQPKLTRYYKQTVDTYRNIVNFKTRDFKKRLTPEIKKVHIFKKPPGATIRKKSDGEIEKFEAYLRKIPISVVDRRFLYNIKNFQSIH